jgi:hypothetical protein
VAPRVPNGSRFWHGCASFLWLPPTIGLRTSLLALTHGLAARLQAGCRDVAGCALIRRFSQTFWLRAHNRGSRPARGCTPDSGFSHCTGLRTSTLVLALSLAARLPDGSRRAAGLRGFRGSRNWLGCALSHGLSHGGRLRAAHRVLAIQLAAR